MEAEGFPEINNLLVSADESRPSGRVGHGAPVSRLAFYDQSRFQGHLQIQEQTCIHHGTGQMMCGLKGHTHGDMSVWTFCLKVTFRSYYLYVNDLIRPAGISRHARSRHALPQWPPRLL